ncbi:MAG: hypothetical protein V1811_03070 [Candidatus Micrarchaeota archaeon]
MTSVPSTALAVYKMQALRKDDDFKFDDFEKRLKDRVHAALKERPDDFKHTVRVVENIKQLINREGGSRETLVPVAYLHEVVNFNYLAYGDTAFTLEGRKKISETHYQQVSEKARKILDGIGFPNEKSERVIKVLAAGHPLELQKAHRM